MTEIAFLGMGSMGRRMVARLTAEHRVTVFNRTRARAEQVAASSGASVARTPREAAVGAGFVITMLSDADAIREVYGGPDGVLAGLEPGALCIDMSTISPREVHDLAALTRSRQAGFVDAPVSGSVALAQSGELTIMVGGDDEAYARARPILSAMGTRVYHVGPLGCGASIKLAVNSIVYGLSGALSEALVMVERAGIERNVAYEIFANSAIAAPFVHYRREAFEHPGEVPVAFRLVLARKDLLLAIDMAEELGLELTQARTNLGVVEAAIDAGYGDQDMSAVAEHLRAGGAS